MNLWPHMRGRCFVRQRANEGSFRGAGNPEGAEWWGNGPCLDCVALVAGEVRAMPRLYLDLAEALAGGGTAPARVGTIITGPHPQSRPPMDMIIRDTMSSMHWTLTAWEPVVRELARMGPEKTRGVRDGWAVQTAASIISPNVKLLSGAASTPGYWRDQELIEECDGLDAIAHLRKAHRRAMGVLGLSDEVVEEPGPCATCGQCRVRRKVGETHTWCDGCRAQSTIDEHRRHAAAQAIASLRR